nr:restriction endonuclease [Pseudomonas fluorescens]
MESAETTPDKELADAHQALIQSLAEDLLAQVRVASAIFFEQLVVDLMLAMGYGSSRKGTRTATQATNDDGIDGIITEDKLGLDRSTCRSSAGAIRCIDRRLISLSAR